jgi:hypothetical protein
LSSAADDLHQPAGERFPEKRVPPLAVAKLGDIHEAARETLPPYWALFAKGQLRWTLVGVVADTGAA